MYERRMVRGLLALLAVTAWTVAAAQEPADRTGLSGDPSGEEMTTQRGAAQKPVTGAEQPARKKLAAGAEPTAATERIAGEEQPAETELAGETEPTAGKKADRPMQTAGTELAGETAPTAGAERPAGEKLAAGAEPTAGTEQSGGTSGKKFIHRIGIEYRPEYIFPSNPFVAGRNASGEPIDIAQSAHLRYALQYRPETAAARICGDVYQGVGIARYDFGSPRETGDPVAVYLFQGARIARLAPRLTLNYEWNFGLSFGWHPYHPDTNSWNGMTGSRLNAYLNVDFYLRWALSQRVGLVFGPTLTHFSNGNTKFPNAGLNTLGTKIGLTCDLGTPAGAAPQPQAARPPFPRHMSYDLTLFGSWRRKGVRLDGRLIPSPEAYPVAGISFAAMYNFGYRFRAGLAADGVYDGSANVYTEDYIVGWGEEDPGYTFHKPGTDRQLSLGLSARAEFVMPLFTVGIGIGANVLHKGGDLAAVYQLVTLKIAATRSTYLHIGYSLQNFRDPNFLMLGVGYRFNNRCPRLR